MKLFLHLFLISATTTIITAVSSSNNSFEEYEKVRCPCLYEFRDECILREYCVYGINDKAELYFNGRYDEMDLTNAALTRKEEIKRTLNGHEDDDVLVNLYSPQSKAEIIFYYGCRNCEDLKALGSNITVSKTKVFLLSLYNQRMKLNMKYSQSDFQYYSDPADDVQLMPEISVRPFWKNRLMFNQSCARKLQEFTQKHFIPAFLTQDLCILDYKYIQFLSTSIPGEYDEFQTTNGEITYSLTLSFTNLYLYHIVINSTSELPSEFQNVTDRCKASFSVDSNERFLRYFCLCDTRDCTFNVTSRNPLNICPSKLALQIDTTVGNTEIYKTTDFFKVDEFFFKNGDNNDYCFLTWRTKNTSYDIFIRRLNYSLPLGYQTDTRLSKSKVFCPMFSLTKDKVEPLVTRFYNTTAADLRYAFLNVTSDHTKIFNDSNSPVGARCSHEGTLSDPFFSSAYAANSSSFPCYTYFEMSTPTQISPMMGINVMPITVVKGKTCYYYTVKLSPLHLNACTSDPVLSALKISSFPPVVSVAACPENTKFNQEEVNRMYIISSSCPTMKQGESQWRYENITGYLCGQFIRGLKFQNGKYVPGEVEFRGITAADLEMVGMKDDERGINVEHGCGFNVSQQLTICTCYAALGGCDSLYMVGRIHLLRYLPFDHSTWG